VFKFNESISFQVLCDTQEEIDHYWERLSEGGDPMAQQCGWLKDKFGVSWQVVPRGMAETLKDSASEPAQRGDGGRHADEEVRSGSVTEGLRRVTLAEHMPEPPRGLPSRIGSFAIPPRADTD